MKSPLFSIIIPTYNRAHVLSAAIESVLNQTFSDFEIIVIDDGSKDNTHKVIMMYLSDARVHYYKQENQGVSKARNFGATKSLGKYLIFLDSDDQLKINYLKEIHSDILLLPDIVFVGIEFLIGNKIEKNVFPSRPYGKVSEEGLYLAGSFIIKREVFINIGGYDHLLKYGENTELSFRLAKHNLKKIFIDKVLMTVNQPSSGRESTSPENLAQSVQHILNKHVDLSRHIRYLFNQVAGVAFLRLQQYDKAKFFLLRAYVLKPYQLKTLFRLFLSFTPILSRRIYTKRS